MTIANNQLDHLYKVFFSLIDFCELKIEELKCYLLQSILYEIQLVPLQWYNWFLPNSATCELVWRLKLYLGYWWEMYLCRQTDRDRDRKREIKREKRWKKGKAVVFYTNAITGWLWVLESVWGRGRHWFQVEGGCLAGGGYDGDWRDSWKEVAEISCFSSG